MNSASIFGDMYGGAPGPSTALPMPSTSLGSTLAPAPPPSTDSTPAGSTVGTSAPPARGKAGRLARSKAACSECHRAKQRCDGPSKIPCHRCEMHGFACTFPSSVGPVPSATTLNGSAAPGAPKRAGKAKEEQLLVTSTEDAPNVAEQLKLMHARLANMERLLTQAAVRTSPFNPSSVPGPSSGGPVYPSPDGASPKSHSHSASGVQPSAAEPERRENPIETAGEAMAVEGLVDLGLMQASRNWETETRPDVIDRGLMTAVDCQIEFNFFHQHLNPWAMLLSSQTDKDAMAVRARSSLLFHSVLVLSIYYRHHLANGAVLYRAVCSIIDSLVAPFVLCAQPEDLTSDLLRALVLLLLYKPLQHAAMAARGVKSDAQIERASKLSVTASIVLRALSFRVAGLVNLPGTSSKFLQAFHYREMTPMPLDIINEHRLYLVNVFHDFHGALQSGKPPNFDVNDAAKTARMFAELKSEPSDVRLAASVELGTTAYRLLSEAGLREHRNIEMEEMRNFNDELDAWEGHWVPVLSDTKEDLLAFTAVFPYAHFYRCVINAYAFSRWKAERDRWNDQQPGQPFFLNAVDRSSIRKAIKAAETMVFALSIESRTLNGLGREVRWEEDADGHSPPLTADEALASYLKWASDSITTVVHVYPLVFLARLASSGLMYPNLELIAPSSPPITKTRFLAGDKLCRLLELGAAVIELSSPTPHHPAMGQAKFLRRLRDAGVNGSSLSRPRTPEPGMLSENDIFVTLPNSVEPTGLDLPETDFSYLLSSNDPSGFLTEAAEMAFPGNWLDWLDNATTDRSTTDTFGFGV